MKKIIKKVKPRKTASYIKTNEDLVAVIVQVMKLSVDAQKNGDKIAMWAMNMIYEDLIKTHTRIGNIRLTVKGDQS